MTTIEKLVLFLESSGFKIDKCTDDTIFFKQCKSKSQQQTEINNLHVTLTEAGLKTFSIQSSVLHTQMINPDGIDDFTMFTYSLTDFEAFSKLNVFRIDICMAFYVVGNEVTEEGTPLPSCTRDMYELVKAKGGFSKVFYDWNLVDFIASAPTTGIIDKL